MEKAILDTLSFFKTSLKAYQIHKWLNKKVKLRQVENTLIKMYKTGLIDYRDGHYFLRKSDGEVLKTDQLSWQDKIKVQQLRRDPNIRLISTDGSGLYIINGSKSLKVKPHNKDMAYQLLKMKVLYQRDGIYSLLLEENSWVFKFFPNWRSSVIFSEAVDN